MRDHEEDSMTVRLRTLLLLMVALPALVVPADGQSSGQEKAVDLSGRWTVAVTFEGGGGFRGTLTLTQRADRLEGTLVRGSGETPLKGSVSGKSIKLSGESRGSLGTESIEASGTVENENTFRGKLSSRTKGEGTDLGAGGTFVATRRR
jgi:hypothetical protein